jgi:hypothetical protein
MMKSGAIELCNDDEIVDEIEMLIAAIDAPVMLYSDSATNLLPLHGKIPEDKTRCWQSFMNIKAKAMRSGCYFDFSLVWNHSWGNTAG